MGIRVVWVHYCIFVNEFISYNALHRCFGRTRSRGTAQFSHHHHSEACAQVRPDFRAIYSHHYSRVAAEALEAKQHQPPPTRGGFVGVL